MRPGRRAGVSSGRGRKEAESVNKSQLIAQVAEKTGLTKKDTGAAVQGILDAVAQALARDEPIRLAGFGTFCIREKPERISADPRTGKPVVIPASRQPAFRSGGKLRLRLRGQADD